MLVKPISIGVSTQELKRIDDIRGSKNRAEHVRDNAMAYDPEEVEIEQIDGRKAHLKTSLYPLKDTLFKARLRNQVLILARPQKPQIGTTSSDVWR